MSRAKVGGGAGGAGPPAPLRSCLPKPMGESSGHDLSPTGQGSRVAVDVDMYRFASALMSDPSPPASVPLLPNAADLGQQIHRPRQIHVFSSRLEPHEPLGEREAMANSCWHALDSCKFLLLPSDQHPWA